MALCLANSLIACQDFVPYDQLVRYKWWYRNGYMSSTGHCFDIDAATRQSIQVFEVRQRKFAKDYGISFDEMDFSSSPDLFEKFNVNCSKDGVTGNGALTRLAPVPLFFYRDPIKAVEYSGISGRITHGDKKAYDACRYYGALIVATLNGANKADLTSNTFYKDNKQWFGDDALHPDIINIAQGSYKKDGGYQDGIRGKEYIVSALEAALWAFWSDEDSFEKGILSAVNLGDDTDTTAAIYGQLAGAYYGYNKLPIKWREPIYAKDFVLCVSNWIAYEGEEWFNRKLK
jgi:ADP-ribosylglycohydrolase